MATIMIQGEKRQMTQNKWRKIRQIIDWSGIIISVGFMFYVDSLVLKILLGGGAILSLLFIVFEADKKLERFILTRFSKRLK